MQMKLFIFCLWFSAHSCIFASEPKQPLFIVDGDSININVVFFLDLDGMKEINDKLGHEYGDRALINTSKIMHKSFRTTDILSRLGGDEFVVIAVKAQDDYIPIIIQRIKDCVKMENKLSKDYKISLSIGVSKVNIDSENALDEAIKEADKEMYKVKAKNKKEKKSK